MNINKSTNKVKPTVKGSCHHKVGVPMTAVDFLDKVMTAVLSMDSDSVGFSKLVDKTVGSVTKREHESCRHLYKLWRTANQWSYTQVLLVSSIIESCKFARAYILVTQDSFPGVLCTEVLLSILFEASSWKPEYFLATAKYHVIFPLAWLLRQTLPKAPPGWDEKNKPFFGGAMRKFMRNRLLTLSTRSLTFANGLKEGVKRACERASDEFVFGTFTKHSKTLSSFPTPLSPALAKSITEKADDILQGFEPHIPKELRETSNSACWEKTRGEGGNYELLTGDLGQFSHTTISEYGFIRMVATDLNVTESVYGWIAPDIREAIDLAFQIDRSERRKVKVQHILEPLKVRVITKGCGLVTIIMRSLQKELWNYLVKIPCFSLIGETVDMGHIESLEELSSKTWNAMGRLTKFVSGDYSAATDGLNLWVTKLILDRILLKCDDACKAVNVNPADFRELAEDSIYEQEIHYPSLDGQDDVPPVEQQTGQLMGSILSFLILCMANLIAYMETRERDGSPPLPLRQLPVLVNGDDIAFKTNDSGYEIWEKTVGEFGFTLSPGKNYFHPTVVTINSQMYHYTHSSAYKDTNTPNSMKPHLFEKVNMYNVGLLTGQSKISGRENAKDLPVNEAWNQIYRQGVQDPVAALQFFIKYNAKALKKASHYGLYNFFLPTHYGGLGMIRPEGFKLKVTAFQKQFASWYYHKINSGSKLLGPKLVQETSGKGMPMIQDHRPIRIIHNTDVPAFREDKDYTYRLPSNSRTKVTDLVMEWVFPTDKDLAQFRRDKKEKRCPAPMRYIDLADRVRIVRVDGVIRVGTQNGGKGGCDPPNLNSSVPTPVHPIHSDCCWSPKDEKEERRQTARVSGGEGWEEDEELLLVDPDDASYLSTRGSCSSPPTDNTRSLYPYGDDQSSCPRTALAALGPSDDARSLTTSPHTSSNDVQSAGIKRIRGEEDTNPPPSGPCIGNWLLDLRAIIARQGYLDRYRPPVDPDEQINETNDFFWNEEDLQDSDESEEEPRLF